MMLNKKVLIISPYFPPVNAADMQRVRMSLPYFKDFGWDAEVVTVDESYVDMVKDNLLLQSIPKDIRIHKVKALDKSWTSKIGLGSIALRSLLYYKQTVNALLKRGSYNLIYFSTTQFPVCILGAYWKRRYGISYVIDMQDPWHSDYYRDKPKSQRPPKYWFSYRLNKYLEPIAIKKAGGLISVSQAYIDVLKKRYPAIKNIPAETITFGLFEPDLEIAIKNSEAFPSVLNYGYFNIVYVGRGGADMHKAIAPLFSAFKNGLQTDKELFNKIKFHFIGTSYAPTGSGTPTIAPLAAEYGIEDHVIEITDRISYYHSLAILQKADALFVPGSDDPQYSASKIYPCLLMKKPLLTVLHPHSNVVNMLKTCVENALVFTFETPALETVIQYTLTQWANSKADAVVLNNNADAYTAKNLTGKQVELFNQVLKR
ncbi:hypothetical protein HQ865_12005 [Mucilaginibacter mali]|uniref:Glycosyltransferase subfamily 4-like N-terminal domain-containing protein n=1 Tax=Mucilaginibacter mali TaxID=2740462 RepID=A0A7D4QT62_9SPHI|nr:hypothetical protein [Mucilaginibacter mali]QKJ30449.1 hypothetical protein HQ865_12005 [Mucilaginibacter mali]